LERAEGGKSEAHSAVSKAPAYSWHAEQSPQSGSGGTFCFTVNLPDRRWDLLLAWIDRLRDAVRRVVAQRPFRIDAWVFLPDHLHCLWTLPQDDADLPKSDLSSR
jgi:REP element-mobilizing transposase RayT